MKLVRKISESLFGTGGAEERHVDEQNDSHDGHDESRASTEHDDRHANERDDADEGQPPGGDEATDDEDQHDGEHEATGDEDQYAGEHEATGDEAAHSNDSADDQEPSESEAGDADRQQHGRHWTTLVPDENRAAGIERIVKSTVEDGDVVEQSVQGGMDVTSYRFGDGPVGTVAMVRNETVVRAYPVVEGVSHDLDIESVTEWDSGLEAWIDGSLDEAPITTFAANYFAHLDSDIADECTASLGLLAYTVRTADDDTIVTEAGTEIDISDFIGILPRQRDASDDYVVRTEIKELERVSVGEFGGYYLRVPLFRMDDGEEFDVGLFVADHVAGDYEPEVGDTIEGACWLQAWLQTE